MLSCDGFCWYCLIWCLALAAIEFQVTMSKCVPAVQCAKGHSASCCNGSVTIPSVVLPPVQCPVVRLNCCVCCWPFPGATILPCGSLCAISVVFSPDVPPPLHSAAPAAVPQRPYVRWSPLDKLPCNVFICWCLGLFWRDISVVAMTLSMCREQE